MVSVAMAAYNGERFIRSQIKSIIDQMKENDELVVSVNTSTDNTLKIVQEMAEEDHRIVVIDNPVPGVNSNFDLALSNCHGDYIFISDQDDLWELNKIETVSQYLNEGYEMVFHDSASIDSNDQIIQESFFANHTVNTSVIRTFAAPRQSGCCMGFTKGFLEAVLPIPDEVESYDHWLAMMAVLRKKTIVINDVLIKHRLHDSNVTVKKRRGLIEIAKSRMNLLKALKRRRSQTKKQGRGA